MTLQTSLIASEPEAALAALVRMRSMVAARVNTDGRTDSLYPGLRYYRFSNPVQYDKAQLLMPGVVIVLQGRKTATLADQSLSYDQDNCLVLGAETVCNGTIVEASASHPYFAVHLDLPLDILVKSLVALADRRELVPAKHVTQSFIAPAGLKVLEAFTRLLSAIENLTDCRTIAPLVIEEIILRLLQSPAAAAIRSTATMNRAGEKVNSAIQFMRANFASPLSSAAIARHVAMSASHFAHSFRAVAGVSPMRYLRNLRLEEARILMLGMGMRASEAATQVGFESSAHFAREFKKRFELSPTEYVRRTSLR